MKTTTQSRLILSVAAFAGLFAVAQAWTTPVAENQIDQVVTVAAKRMSTEEKIAFDTAGQPVQQVIISAQKLTEQEKIAFDTEGQPVQQVVVSARKLSEQEKIAFDAHQAAVAQAFRAANAS